MGVSVAKFLFGVWSLLGGVRSRASVRERAKPQGPKASQPCRQIIPKSKPQKNIHALCLADGGGENKTNEREKVKHQIIHSPLSSRLSLRLEMPVCSTPLGVS